MNENAKYINNLVTTHPELAKQWHPTKNGNLKPSDFTQSSSEKVWWFFPYDDPKTGKHFDFEWKTGIINRTRGSGCPYLVQNPLVWVGFNDLKTHYPQLAKEWHPTKNGNLKPTDVTCGSDKKVWWYLPYDDPKSGKHFDFEWQARIHDRAFDGNNCPYLSNKKIFIGFNDFASNFPELAKQWHPTKNGDLKPTDITIGNDKRVWWLFPYDDPKSGKHFDFEWQASIFDRTNGGGCPYLSGKKIFIGFNDFASNFPELAKQWHPTKNGDLKPTDVTIGSNKKVWWYLPYDDSKTGKHFDFEWKASIVDRTTTGGSCPYLSSQKLWGGFNDLASVCPNLVKEWHPTKNGDLKPSDVFAGSGKEVWWLLPYDDPIIGKHFDFEWKAKITTRVKGESCPYLSNRRVWTTFNDLETYCNKNNLKYILDEWNDKKNGSLKPNKIVYGSSKEVFWKCPSGHTYKRGVINRVSYHQNCPICAKEQKTSFPEQSIYYYVKKYFSDAESNNVDILNGREVDIYIPSIKVAIEYDGQQWHSDIKKDTEKNELCKERGIFVYRIRESKCPTMNNNEYIKVINCISNNEKSLETAILQLFRCFNITLDINIARDRAFIYGQYMVGHKKGNLAETHPDLALEWHPTKNGDLKPINVTFGSSKKVWWFFPYDDPKTGKHFDFEWQASISSRAKGLRCPFISNHLVWKGFNDLETHYPQLAKEWHPTKNGDLKPTDVTIGSNKKVWWYLPYDDPKTGKHFDFEWCTSVNCRISGRGCPYLSTPTRLVWKGFNDITVTHPHIAKEWHPTKNGDLSPSDFLAGSETKVWWYLPYDDPKTGKHFDFEWDSTINSRTLRGGGCPYLSHQRIWVGFNDLETYCKENHLEYILQMWDYNKNGNLKPTDVTVSTNKKVWFIDADGNSFQKSICYVVPKIAS